MAVKKKRTAKQIAATKKLVAANKKRAKTKRRTVKKKVVKKVTKKKVGRKSQITKKRPTARLKARRAKVKKKGYFPNPIEYFITAKIKGKKKYFNGVEFTLLKGETAYWTNKQHVMRVADLIANTKRIQVAIEIKK